MTKKTQPDHDQPLVDESNQAAASTDTANGEEMIALKQYQALAAEYANYQKRTEQHLLELRANLETKLLAEIAPLLDNLTLAKAYQPSELTDNQWANGLIMIGQQAQTLFERWGITAIPTVGESFDPRWHEAIAEQPATDEFKTGQIMTQVEAGYRRGDQLLRVAKVIVAA